jgi:pyruvate/2-oxoglutarate dehydrogenase complex dihydrolipoamide dehydrogenase (E3) component
MSRRDYCDVLVGGGQAATPLARALAGAGRRVGVAERKHLGGSCVNFGRTPTKAALASAKVAHRARRAAEYGLEIPEVRVDFPAVIGRARDMTRKGRNGLESSMQKSGNPELLWEARPAGRPGGGRLPRARWRAAGARRTGRPEHRHPHHGSPIEGLEEVDLIHSGNWLERENLPEHLVVVGGGYIGLEMAQFYLRMGGRVRVVVSGEQVAAREDRDVAEAIRELLEAEGIEFAMNRRAEDVERRNGGVSVALGRGFAPLRRHGPPAEHRRRRAGGFGEESGDR